MVYHFENYILQKKLALSWKVGRVSLSFRYFITAQRSSSEIYCPALLPYTLHLPRCPSASQPWPAVACARLRPLPCPCVAVGFFHCRAPQGKVKRLAPCSRPETHACPPPPALAAAPKLLTPGGPPTTLLTARLPC